MANALFELVVGTSCPLSFTLPCPALVKFQIFGLSYDFISTPIKISKLHISWLRNFYNLKNEIYLTPGILHSPVFNALVFRT